jgi:hypothetical protein
MQLASVKNLSSSGVWFRDPPPVKPGEINGSAARREKAQFRVVWGMQAGNPGAGEIGIAPAG